jgi:hypothetical protein
MGRQHCPKIAAPRLHRCGAPFEATANHCPNIACARPRD